jgi:hypothetical protein
MMPSAWRKWDEGAFMIKYVYEIDYPLGEKRKYLEWVRSIADTLQAPGELKRLASYDNAFSASPHRVIEFTFDSMADAGKYFDRKEMVRIFQGELPAHGENIHIKVLTLRGDYTKDLGTRDGIANRQAGDEGHPAPWADPLGQSDPESARFEPDASQ